MNLNLTILNIIRYFLKYSPNGRSLYKRVSNSRYIKFLLPKQNTQILTHLNNGISITVDVKDYNGRMLYIYGSAYPETIETCQSLLSPGDIFLDIGANYGVVGLMCQDIVGSDGEIHLFEPQPELCHRLKDAIHNNSLSNVVLHDVGLMNQDGVLEMCRSSEHTGEASFVFKDSEATDKISLKVKNIQTYLPPLLTDRNFGAKVDVEGAELYLLPWLLEQNKLKFIVFENTHIPLEEKISLFQKMEHYGFSLFGIDTQNCETILNPIQEFTPESTKYHDVLCCKDRKMIQKLKLASHHK